MFIQWVTSKAKAKEYVESGGVSGRQSTYRDKDLTNRKASIRPTHGGVLKKAGYYDGKKPLAQ
jgi:hypothetical protein